MARKPRTKRVSKPAQEELDGIVRAEHASGEVSEATERKEEVSENEDEALAQEIINLGFNDNLEDAKRRVMKLTKQERVMLLERTHKPPE